MTEPKNGATRREFLKTTGQVAAASALAGVAVPSVHAAGDDAIKIALVGCGGRGTGAAANALATKGGPIKLVAMADVFKDRLDGSYDAIKNEHSDKIDVPDDRKFIGFDGLQEGDGLRRAGRDRDPGHPAGLPLGPVHLRDREGPATPSWRSPSPSTARPPARCSRWARRRPRRTSRSASA